MHRRLPTLLLLAALLTSVAAQEPARRWEEGARERTPAELSVMAWNGARRMNEMEARLKALEKGAVIPAEEWITLRVRIDQLFYVIAAIASAVSVAFGAWVVDMVRKRAKG